MTTPNLVARFSQHRYAGMIAVFALAFMIRLAFVAWAPGEPTGDAMFYRAYAERIASGMGYVEDDGSPAILWMPGWPIMLAGLELTFGSVFLPGKLLNVVMGAATAALLVGLGGRLFRPSVGLAAGALYAIWPGNVYYVATLMAEPAFNFLLASVLYCLVRGAQEPERAGWRWIAASGLLFGWSALVKAEPVVLLPVFLLYLAVALPSRELRVHYPALLVLATVLVIAPWSIRNTLTFDRFIPTTMAGGMNFWIGNHEGAGSGWDWPAANKFRKRHQRATAAESNLAQAETGWREGFEFIREDPGEWVAVMGRKLRHTYDGDNQGARLIRGVGVGEVGFISEDARVGLSRFADVYWFAVMALAVLGVTRLSAWPAATRVLVLGLPLAWIAVHMLFLGGHRFHAPETLVYAMLAAVGGEWLWGRMRPRGQAAGEGG